MNKYFTVNELQHGLCMFDIFTGDEEVAIVVGDIEYMTVQMVLLALGYCEIEVGL